MPHTADTNDTIWTIAKAKAKLSELLRLADDQPQYIGTKKSYVVISAEQWEKLNSPPEDFGQWLIRNMSGVGELELPERIEPTRKIPFE